MTIDELLAIWRDDGMSETELRALTAMLDQPAHRQRLVDDWLVEAALPEALTTPAWLPAALAPPRSTQVRSTTFRRLRHPAAALAACAALLLAGWMIHLLPTRHKTPEVGSALASIQDSIQRVPLTPPPSLPTWMSPTASLLEPARLPADF